MSENEQPDEIKELCEERFNIVKELKELSAERKEIEANVLTISVDAMAAFRQREVFNIEVKELKQKRDSLKSENKKLESMQTKYKEMEYDMNIGRVSMNKEKDFFKRLSKLKIEIENEKKNPSPGKIDKKVASARHKEVVEKSKSASDEHNRLASKLKLLADITDIADGNSVRRRKLQGMFESVQSKINEKYDNLKGGRPNKAVNQEVELASIMDRLKSGEAITTDDLMRMQGGF